MSPLALPLDIDALELAFFKEQFAEGWGKQTGKVIAQRNLISNPNFESNVSGWQAANASSVIARDTVEKYSGSASCQTVCQGTVVGEGVYYVPIALTTVKQGNRISGAVRIKAPVGATLEIIVLTTSNADYRTSNYTGTGNWDLVTVIDSSVSASLNPYMVIRTRVSAQAITFNVDSAVVSLGTVAPQYMDGDTPDNNVFTYEWEGTPGNSSSIKWSTKPVLAENLVKDPLFNRPAAGVDNNGAWAPYTGMPTPVKEGNELHCTLNGSTLTPRVHCRINNLVGGRTYTMVYWVRAANIANSGLKWYCGPKPTLNNVEQGSTIISTSGVLYNNMSAVKVVQTFTLDANMDGALFVVGVTSDGGNITGDMWISKPVFFDASSEVSGYFDPRSSDAAWTGTSDQSTSVLFNANANSINWLEQDFFAKGSGLTPKEKYSIADHKMAFLKAKTIAYVGDPLPVVARNYVLNSDFESNPPGISRWNTTGSYYNNSPTSAVAEAVNPYSRTNSCLVTTPGTNFLEGINTAITSGLRANTTYTISAYVAWISGRPVVINVRDRTNSINGSGPASGSSSSSSSAAYTRISQVVTTGSNPVNDLLIAITTDNVALGASQFRIDAVMVSEGNTLIPYFNGASLTTTRFVGNANDSISEKVDPTKASIGELWISYLMNRSGIPYNKPWGEHEMAFYKNQLGL